MIRFGTWVGGDRDGNPAVTPEVTMATLELAHDHGLRNLITAVEALAEEISVSTRIKSDRRRTRRIAPSRPQELPPVWQRFHELNANEPYRFKCAFIHQRLINTRQAILQGGRPGPATSCLPSLMNDLDLMDASLRDNDGELMAEGALARLRRRVVDLWLPSRHARHSPALGSSSRMRWPSSTPASGSAIPADRDTRETMLAAELTNPRPLVGSGEHP